MADLKISQLTGATTPLAGTEVLPIVQSSTTKKVATDDLTVKNVRSNATTGILQIAGPGAGTTRTMTTPNANFSAARIDAAQSFTGNQTFSAVVIDNATNGAAVINSGTSGSAVNQAMTFNHSPGGGAYAYTNIQISGADVFSSGKQLSTYAGNTTINAPYSTGAIIFKIDGTQYFSLSSAGNLTQAVAAKGVNFTANTPAAGMTSQLLNWYEEGTWTPTVTSSTGTITSYFSAGRYTRIGNQVVLTWYVGFTNNGTGAGYLNITGAPFAPLVSNTALHGWNQSSGASCTGGIDSTAMYAYKYDGTYPAATGQTINFSITYFV